MYDRSRVLLAFFIWVSFKYLGARENSMVRDQWQGGNYVEDNWEQTMRLSREKIAASISDPHKRLNDAPAQLYQNIPCQNSKVRVHSTIHLIPSIKREKFCAPRSQRHRWNFNYFSYFSFTKKASAKEGILPNQYHLKSNIGLGVNPACALPECSSPRRTQRSSSILYLSSD